MERFMPIYHMEFGPLFKEFIKVDIRVKKIITNPPALIVFWEDGTKTVVKRQEGDTYDIEKGFAMAFIKKILGNKGNYNNYIKDALTKLECY